MVTTRSQTIGSSEAPPTPEPLCNNQQMQSPVISIDSEPDPTECGAMNESDSFVPYSAASTNGTEDCLCCVDHTQLFEEHNKMIEEHEKHMQEREAEIDGLYARVRIERRELEQLREEYLEQKSAHSQLLDRYAAHFSGREAEMAQMFESLRGERAELRQHIIRYMQEKQAQSELRLKHEAQVGEVKQLFEEAKESRRTWQAAAQQVDWLAEIFQTVWKFVETRKSSA